MTNEKFGVAKMGIFWTLLATTPFFLAFTTALNSGELCVAENTTTNELTCISKDEDVALVWNYDLSTNESSHSFNNFKPVKPIQRNIPRCAVWGSGQCLATWETLEQRNTVNSLAKPMGPVIDYRWEGFKEEVMSDHLLCSESESRPTDGTVVFSVRGIDDILVHLCDYEMSVCFVVTIAVKGGYFGLQNCYGHRNRDKQVTEYETCEKIVSSRHEIAAFDAHEWRTFRFQWINIANVVMVFNDTESNAFLQGNFSQWHRVCNIKIESTASARLKLHAYDYILVTDSFQTLITEPFSWYVRSFCVDMLVSLCPRCRVDVSLVDNESSKELAKTGTYGDQSFRSNKQKLWRSIKLDMDLQSQASSQIKLNISFTVIGNDNSEVWWAIDNLRICGRNNGLRASTIQLLPSSRRKVNRNIKCQKLSHGKVITVNSSMSAPCGDISEIIDLDEWDRSSSLTDRKEIWLVTVLIAAICLLVLLLLFSISCWYRRGRVQRSLLQNVLLDEPVCMISDNSREQTSHAQNDSLTSVYLIPIDCSRQTNDTQNFSSDLPYFNNESYSSEKEMSYTYDVSLNPVYTNTRTDSRDQTSQSRDFLLDPLYANCSDNLRMRTSYAQDVSMDSVYYATIPDNGRQRANYSQDIFLEPVYTTVPDDSREHTTHARDVSLDPVDIIVQENSQGGTNYSEDDSSGPLYVNIRPKNLRERTRHS